MYFNTKNYLKNTHNYITKHALINADFEFSLS